ncbi:hypothetical protein C8J57DRAFT_1223725 [Mycena rebaudengoi]|nr:hypothetical protein C8J57DRAFT_1223725 [Mycena rebaudengoi]
MTVFVGRVRGIWSVEASRLVRRIHWGVHSACGGPTTGRSSTVVELGNGGGATLLSGRSAIWYGSYKQHPRYLQRHKLLRVESCSIGRSCGAEEVWISRYVRETRATGGHSVWSGSFWAKKSTICVGVSRSECRVAMLRAVVWVSSYVWKVSWKELLVDVWKWFLGKEFGGLWVMLLHLAICNGAIVWCWYCSLTEKMTGGSLTFQTKLGNLPGSYQEINKSGVVLSQKGYTRREAVAKIALSFDEDVPIYDGRGVPMNFKTGLSRVSTLPLFVGEIPFGSFVMVAYTVTGWNTIPASMQDSAKQPHIGCNILWAIVMGVQEAPPANVF